MRSKILIVDDETANLKLMRQVLRGEYDLIFSKEGPAALELALQQPDLILLDIMMPEMNGFEVCRRLKSEASTREIPIIFITAKGDLQDELEGFALGAVDYITKPISPPIVKARVQTHLLLRNAFQKLAAQNAAMVEAEQLRRDIERITRHDLKSPLNGLIGFTDLLMIDGRLQPDQMELAKIVKDLGFRVLNLVNLSLGLFKMEQGTYLLESQEVNMVPLVERVLGDVGEKLQRQKLDTQVLLQQRPVLPGDRFTVFGEELLCYSILINLITNALEAAPKGSTLTITMGRDAESVDAKGIDNMAEMTIHNGGAVPLGIRKRFFEKYATEGKKYGTGLGTYSAKLITETQKGTLRMATSETEGTTLYITLPKSGEDPCREA